MIIIKHLELNQILALNNSLNNPYAVVQTKPTPQ